MHESQRIYWSPELDKHSDSSGGIVLLLCLKTWKDDGEASVRVS